MSCDDRTAVSTYPNNPCLGHRVLDAKGQIGPYQYQTYKQVSDRIRNFGAGLRSLGIHDKSRIGLYAINRAEWVILINHPRALHCPHDSNHPADDPAHVSCYDNINPPVCVCGVGFVSHSLSLSCLCVSSGDC